ncbi:MAG: NosD domain-containing protein [Candidatus Hodarchaeales archaeon]|jgi:parallel beta-helix repeat protein
MKTNFFNVFIFLILIPIPFNLLLEIHPTTAQSIIYVDDDGTADFTTIQEAINAANSGDTIIVKDGVYSENIIVNKSNLSVESENGFLNTIIKSNTTYLTVEIVSDYVNFTGFTISREIGNANSLGISLDQARYCRIFQNYIINNTCGIRITGGNVPYGKAGYNLVENNTLLNDFIDIQFSYSTNNELKKNIMLKGIFISGSALGTFTHYIDSTNTVNKRSLFYIYQKNEYLVPENAGQIVIVNSSNVVIENQEISNISVATAVVLSSHIKIRNNVLRENLRGIYIKNSINSLVSNNTVVYSKSYYSEKSMGIQLGLGLNNTVSNNDLSHNYYGILTSNEIGGKISENTFENNTFGINTYSKNNSISLNNFSNNKITGIHLNSGSTNNLLIKNNFVNNQQALDESNPGQNNYIYFNNFVDNVKTISGLGSALFNSPNPVNYIYKEKFYHSYVGNYWSDYQGSDQNSDGIGEASYSVSVSKTDNYPLMMSFEEYQSIDHDYAKTWFVDDDLTDYPAADFMSIQEAVNAASDGETIIVFQGTYIENVKVNKSVTIESYDGPDVTVVQASNNQDHVFKITSNNVTINGFTIERADYTYCAGFFINRCEFATISNNIGKNNWWFLYLYNSNHSFITNNFYDNSTYLAYSNNNTIRNNDGSSLQFDISHNNDLLNNNFRGYTGIYIQSSKHNSITNNTFIVDHDGITLYLSDYNLINNNSLSNTGQSKEYFPPSGIEISTSAYNIFSNNIISHFRDGIIFNAGSYNNTFTRNNVSQAFVGIQLFQSMSNRIYFNNFRCINDVYVYTWTITNFWVSQDQITYNYSGQTYTNYTGNYWYNYDGNDNNQDGIGDMPFNGSINSNYYMKADNDTHPLMEPFENYIKREDTSTPSAWTFAIITDLHIGRGYEDYNGEDYYLTKRLKDTVNWIYENRKTRNIKFVAVLGDISENGKFNELLKARQILDRGLKEIPFFPTIGNHDSRGFTTDGHGGSNSYNIIFNTHFFQQQFNKLGLADNQRDFQDDDLQGNDLQNYAFHYGGINFLGLDFVKRNIPKKLLVEAKLHPQTIEWLKKWIDTPPLVGQQTILFSHHPMTYIHWYGLDPPLIFDPAFDDGDIENLEKEISGWDDVHANFAGHIHGYYDPNRGWWPRPPQPVTNPDFMDANTFYGGPDGVPVITTEALMVGFNNASSDGFIRLINVTEDKIDFFGSYEGRSLPALNPYFVKVKAPSLAFIIEDENLDLERLLKLYNGEILRVDFEIYAFTNITQGGLLSFSLQDKNGEVLHGFTDYHYDLLAGLLRFHVNFEPRKEYDLILNVTFFKPDGELISEIITRKITTPTKQPSLWYEALCPIDLIITDPEGLLISKDANEIPRAFYIEVDLNNDDDIDDIIILSEHKIGNYLVTVIPDPEAAPTDTFTLKVFTGDSTLIIAENVKISEIPDQPYVINSNGTHLTIVQDQSATSQSQLPDNEIILEDILFPSILLFSSLILITITLRYTRKKKRP